MWHHQLYFPISGSQTPQRSPETTPNQIPINPPPYPNLFLCLGNSRIRDSVVIVLGPLAKD
ncbi:GD14089 [Drosophila simulans]|uniref:GD14089 n=1 Tax=Drosophila simulans TaxID=7240 RepID=B4QLP0_DROSI|nr:GD14089 [Drosophila simulans]